MSESEGCKKEPRNLGQMRRKFYGKIELKRRDLKLP